MSQTLIGCSNISAENLTKANLQLTLSLGVCVSNPMSLVERHFCRHADRRIYFVEKRKYCPLQCRNVEIEVNSASSSYPSV